MFNSLPVTIFINAMSMAAKIFVFDLVVIISIGSYMAYFGSQGQIPSELLVGANLNETNNAINFASIPIVLAFVGDILLSLLIYRYFWDNKSAAAMFGGAIGSAIGFLSIAIAVGILVSNIYKSVSIWHVIMALVFTSIGTFIGRLEGSRICQEGVKKGLRI